MLFRVVGSFLGNHDFNELHPAHRVTEVQTDDAVGGNSAVRQLADWKRGGVCLDNRFRASLHRRLSENYLFDIDLFEGGFDHKLDIAQFQWRGRSEYAAEALFP